MGFWIPCFDPILCQSAADRDAPGSLPAQEVWGQPWGVGDLTWGDGASRRVGEDFINRETRFLRIHLSLAELF
jgi:hypothetical protein